MTQAPHPHRPRWFDLGYASYQHVAGVLGGIALATVLGPLIDVGWRGALAELIGYWNDYARPAVKLVLDFLIVMPLSALGWHISIPLAVRDYLSVGAIFGLSVLRALHRGGRRWGRADVLVFVLCLVGWPAYVPLFGWLALRSKENRRWMLLALLPVAYLVALLGLNYALGFGNG